MTFHVEPPIKTPDFGERHLVSYWTKMTDFAAWSERETDSDSLKGSAHSQENSHQYLEDLGYREDI